MAWYAIYRNKGVVQGFIEDETVGVPAKWPTEKDALEAMRDHILQPMIEFIEL